jgi:integrase
MLSVCRTAYRYAARRRMLPPFAESPFSLFKVDRLKDAHGHDEAPRIFTPDEERAFFAACSPWQRDVFATLACYGLRLGELTHLLVEDVDFEQGVIHVRSKPWLGWQVKTRRQRQLPLAPAARETFARLIGGRKAGFVFLNVELAAGRKPLRGAASPQALRARAEKVIADVLAERPGAGEKERKRALVRLCRSLGQVPEKRVRTEFIGLTARIGCPGFTRVHDLRHLFASRAQERDMSPLLVQQLLGHSSLAMTGRYTHLGMETKRRAMEGLAVENWFGAGGVRDEREKRGEGPR